MPKVSFRARIAIRGVNPYVIVSKAQAARLKPGWRKPLPVLVRIDSHPRDPHHINLMPVGDGTYYLYLNGIIRKAAAAGVGKLVHTEIEVDAAYRNGPQHAMPTWFRNALNKTPHAKANWASLPPSRKKEVLRYFARLKSTEARARNLARAMDALSGSPTRFMGRAWKLGA